MVEPPEIGDDAAMPDTKSPRHRHQAELHERAIRMAEETVEQRNERHGIVTSVAKQLGIGPESLRSWFRQAEVDRRRRQGVISADQRRIAELECGIRLLWRTKDSSAPPRLSSRGEFDPTAGEMSRYAYAHREPFGVEPICQALAATPHTRTGDGFRLR